MSSFFERQEWLSAVDRLKTKAAEFNALYNRVLSSFYIADTDPDLEREYGSLIKRGDIIKKSVQTLTKGIDYIFSVFDQFFGPDEADNISNLGAVPLVPIAVILSAIAAITYWINDATKYLNKVDEIKRLESQGYTTKEAYKMVNEGGGFLSVLKSPKNLAIAGASIFLLLVLTRRV